jgi:regulator of protease activity HflC (stomatin/prohibitin superfamily)
MMVVIILLAVLLLWFIVASVEIVKENTVYAVEFFGKFERILTPGLNFRIPLLEQVIEVVSLKQQNFTETGRYHTIDNGVVDISTNIIFEVIPTSEGVKKYIYSLEEREKSLAMTIENSLRASIARESFADISTKKEVIVKEVWVSLDTQFKNWGVNIVSFQITGVRAVN